MLVMSLITGRGSVAWRQIEHVLRILYFRTLRFSHLIRDTLRLTQTEESDVVQGGLTPDATRGITIETDPYSQ